MSTTSMYSEQLTRQTNTFVPSDVSFVSHVMKHSNTTSNDTIPEVSIVYIILLTAAFCTVGLIGIVGKWLLSFNSFFFSGKRRFAKSRYVFQT